MRTIIVRTLVAFALVATGWAAARTQMSEANFELVVDAPGGKTTITCVRGCGLAWIERGIPQEGQPQPSFWFSCGAGRCSSGKIGGWITP